MRILAYILTIMLFQLPFSGYFGQVERDYDSDLKKDELPTYKKKSSTSSIVSLIFISLLYLLGGDKNDDFLLFKISLVTCSKANLFLFILANFKK